MNKSLSAILFGGALTLLGSQAQAHDDCYRDEVRYSRGRDYGYREVVRYERPRRYYYEDEPVVVRRRVVVDDDYRPRYSRRSHSDGFLRVFFGGF